MTSIPPRYDIRFEVEVPMPHGECTEMECVTWMPFVPRKGDMLKVTPHDDYREVEAVYWSADRGLEVFFPFAVNTPPNKMKKLGWKEVE